LTRQRLNLDPPSKLVTRDGTVVGQIYSITADLDGGDIGGSSAKQNNTKDGGVGEGAQEPLAPMDDHELLMFKIRTGSPRRPTEVKQATDHVIAHYVAVMAPRSRTAGDFGEDDRRIVRDALKVATVGECCKAIDGCKASDFHMGQNDRRRKYNGLSQILKGKRGGRTTREQIDFFIEIAKLNPDAKIASGDDARVRDAKRDVLNAHAFPGDEHAQQAGNRAAEWLTENGWRVIRDEDGARPRFEQQS